MGLFIRRETPLSTPSYSLHLQGALRLVVGLGNPGKEYEKTRHNVGFFVIDNLAGSQGFPAWKTKHGFKGEVTDLVIAGTRALLLKPHTYMNVSGQSVAACMQFYKLSAQDVLVIYDDKDLPLGDIRVRRSGSSGGHKGITSLIEQIGPDFTRLRIGIANEHTQRKATADFVLDRFMADEQVRLQKISREAVALAVEWIVSAQLAEHTITVE
jgi:PTH1 family peptidyl-tRNA hydrolase